jgi:hypothetical protein
MYSVPAVEVLELQVLESKAQKEREILESRRGQEQ